MLSERRGHADFLQVLQPPGKSANDINRHLAGQSGRFAFADRARRTFRPSKHRQIEARGALPRGLGYAQRQRKDNSMNAGTVKFYNDQKGFGFIQPDDGGKDVFVHATALERAGMRGLVQGQKVMFDTQEDRRTGKIAVGNIQAA
jgi:CspA family cold shock protein